MCIIKHLFKKNQLLKKQVKELKQELKDVKNESDEHRGILLDVLDSYLEEKHLHNDFKEYIAKPKKVNLDSTKNKTLEIWRNFK